MDLHNYVGFGSKTLSYLTYSTVFPNGAQSLPAYRAVNAKGRVDGIELAYQQALAITSAHGQLHVRRR